MGFIVCPCFFATTCTCMCVLYSKVLAQAPAPPTGSALRLPLHLQSTGAVGGSPQQRSASRHACAHPAHQQRGLLAEHSHHLHLRLALPCAAGLRRRGSCRCHDVHAGDARKQSAVLTQIATHRGLWSGLRQMGWDVLHQRHTAAQCAGPHARTGPCQRHTSPHP